MVAKPLEGAPEGVPVQSGYVLTARAIFLRDFTLNHSKDLDKANIQCIFKNITNQSNSAKDKNNQSMNFQKTRLFFNKTVLPLGQVFIRVGDTIELQFFTVDPTDTEQKEEDLKPFSHYQFMVTEEGFKTVTGFS